MWKYCKHRERGGRRCAISKHQESDSSPSEIKDRSAETLRSQAHPHSPPPPFTISGPCAHVHALQTHIHLNSSGSNAEQSLFLLGHHEENRAWYKLEHICFCCIKAKSDIALAPWQNGISQTSSQSKASCDDDIFCQATTRGPVSIVKLRFETLLQLPVCPFMKEEGAARRSSENTVTDFRIPTTYR